MRNKYTIKKFIILLVMVSSAGKMLTAYSQVGWERMEDMSTRRVAHASCAYDNSIYVFGGIDQNINWYSSVEAYDITTNTWIEKAKLTIPSGFFSTGEIHGKIYVVGGAYQGPTTGEGLNSNLEYDPEQDNWLSKENCPSKTGQMASCVLNDKLYVFGGYIFPDYTPNELIRKVYTYKVSSDSWDSAASMPNTHIEGDAIALNGKIYVIGGIWAYLQEDHIGGKLDMYDPATDTWTQLADMLVPVSRHVSISYNNKIYVFGGETEDYIWGTYGGSNLIQEYDPNTDTWKQMQGMPFNRSGSKGNKVGDYFYLIGGEDGEGHRLKEVWRFDLSKLSEPPNSIQQGSLLNNKNFKLLGNSPNPFGINTNISYELSEQGHIQMEIFDLTGKYIHTLYNENQTPGKYEITWNTEDISPGIYFLRMTVNGISQTKKLVKQK